MLDGSILNSVSEDSEKRRAEWAFLLPAAIHGACRALVWQILIEKHFAYRGVGTGAHFEDTHFVFERDIYKLYTYTRICIPDQTASCF